MNRAHNLAVGAFMVVIAAVSLSLTIGAVYVLWHFIEKWW